MSAGRWCRRARSQLEEALTRLCWLLPSSGLGSPWRASQSVGSSWKLHALNALLCWTEEFPCVTGDVHSTGGALVLSPGDTGCQSKQLLVQPEHVLQIRQDLPCLNKAVRVTHLQAREAMPWSPAPWQHRVHTGQPGSQKAGGLWRCPQLC